MHTWRFLSTLSLRRATIGKYAQYAVTGISIHALLAESDYTTMFPAARQNVFLSTLSLRRATTFSAELAKRGEISIHALLAESDFARCRCWVLSDIISIHALLAESDVQRGPRPHERGHFYPRSPCGERPIILCQLFHGLVISIHALLAESDMIRKSISVMVISISIHALLAESDGISSTLIIGFSGFLSTLSLRRATR